MAAKEEQRQAKLLQERIASSLAAGQAAAQSAQIGDQLPRTLKVKQLPEAHGGKQSEELLHGMLDSSMCDSVLLVSLSACFVRFL